MIIDFEHLVIYIMLQELKEERSTIERWQQHLADLRETILSLALYGGSQTVPIGDQHWEVIVLLDYNDDNSLSIKISMRSRYLSTIWH